MPEKSGASQQLRKAEKLELLNRIQQLKFVMMLSVLQEQSFTVAQLPQRYQRDNHT